MGGICISSMGPFCNFKHEGRYGARHGLHLALVSMESAHTTAASANGKDAMHHFACQISMHTCNNITAGRDLLKLERSAKAESKLSRPGSGAFLRAEKVPSFPTG